MSSRCIYLYELEHPTALHHLLWWFWTNWKFTFCAEIFSLDWSGHSTKYDHPSLAYLLSLLKLQPSPLIFKEVLYLILFLVNLWYSCWLSSACALFLAIVFFTFQDHPLTLILFCPLSLQTLLLVYHFSV